MNSDINLARSKISGIQEIIIASCGHCKPCIGRSSSIVFNQNSIISRSTIPAETMPSTPTKRKAALCLLARRKPLLEELKTIPIGLPPVKPTGEGIFRVV